MTERYRCKWCNGTGHVASGAICHSCKGKGWYTNPPSPKSAITLLVISSIFASIFWIIGGTALNWNALHALSVVFIGVVIVALAMWLRGVEEQGWNGLMFIGTLIGSVGILSVAVTLILRLGK
jgi:hypothetical protein